jgi:surfeit locus 1 family protein
MRVNYVSSATMLSFRSLRTGFTTFATFKPYRNEFTTPTRRLFFSKRKTEVPTIYKPRQEPWVNPTMLVIGFIPFFTFGLGTWQLYRLQWKVALIDELEEKLNLHPISLPQKIKYVFGWSSNVMFPDTTHSPSLSVIPEFVFRKVVLRGKWDHARSMLLVPRVREGVHGAHVVTPLIRENGSTVLVDRGFVSNDFISTYQREEGEVEVLGMLRTSQPRNNFTPDNHPEEGLWYWADVDAMAEFAGGEKARVQSVYVEQIFGKL